MPRPPGATSPGHAALPHGLGPPSPWVQRWSGLLAPGASVLDLACGGGRHARWLGERGFMVTGVDRDRGALNALRGAPGLAEVVEADIENGPWPFPGRRFDALVVTNYLWRPLWPTLLGSLAPGGLLVYETFNVDHAQVGRPSNPAFLLAHGELIERCRGLHVIAYENGWLNDPLRAVQRVVARLPEDQPDGQPGSGPSGGPSGGPLSAPTRRDTL